MIDQLLQLVAPVRCVACGVRARLFCDGHVESGAAIPFQLAGLNGYCVTPLSQEIHAAISAFKDKAVTALARDLARICSPLIETTTWSKAELIVYPPSTPKAFRKRGFSPNGMILGRIKSNVPALPLRLVRRISDQRGLGADRRIQNLHGAYLAPNLAGKNVMLFDDVATTGATLSEMHRAVEATGARVTGFCVLARSLSGFEAQAPK